MADDFRRAHRTARGVAVTLLASLAGYVVLVEALRATRASVRLADLSHLEALRYAFFLVAMASLGLARAVRTSLVSRGPGRAAPTPQRLLTGTVLSLALCEVSALLGLGLFLLQGRVFSFYIFLTISLVAMILFFPRADQWRAGRGR